MTLLRTSFLAASCLSALVSLVSLVSACGGTATSPGVDGDTTSTQSLSSPLSFPVGVETSCDAVLTQLSPNLNASTVLQSATSSPTVTLTSSGGVITATIDGTSYPLAPVQFTAISGASATVLPGQTWTVPISTVTASDPASPSESALLPVEGGSIALIGDGFFLSLEMSLGSEGAGTVAAAFECTAVGKAPTDCACAAGEVCSCGSTSTPPLGVYTQCSTVLQDVASSGGVTGGNTTVTLAAQNGELTMTLGGGPDPSSLDLTPTSAATATISGGQSLGGPGASSSNACTPGGDLWNPPDWPIAVSSGSLTTDGQWLTVSLAGTSPCSTKQRLAIVCPTRTP